MPQPVILVTSASSDVGRLTVDALAPHAQAVHAGSRAPVQPAQAANVHWTRMDVRDPQSIASAVDAVIAHSGRIDTLVNNAGLMLGGLLEETDPDAGRELFEINFWGAVEATRRVLPTMRARRSGRIVIVGSLSGRVAPPGQGFYAASKFALAGYAEALAAEVTNFGIQVHLVEPSFHRAELDRHTLWAGCPIQDYDTVREPLREAIGRSVAQGEDPRNLARAIAELALGRRRGFRWPVGREARWVPLLRVVSPERVFQRKLRERFGLA